MFELEEKAGDFRTTVIRELMAKRSLTAYRIDAKTYEIVKPIPSTNKLPDFLGGVSFKMLGFDDFTIRIEDADPGAVMITISRPIFPARVAPYVLLRDLPDRVLSLVRILTQEKEADDRLRAQHSTNIAKP